MATILIVDDQALNRQFLATLLGYREHRVIEAVDGATGLERARTARPDLVIADILMPGMDGYEFVRRLRGDPEVAATPVVFYSAVYQEHEARELAQICGVSHLIVKPCEPEVVLEIVDSALRARNAPTGPANNGEFEIEHSRVLSDKLARTVEELMAANGRLTSLVEIVRRIASAREQHALLAELASAAHELIGGRCAGAVLFGPAAEVTEFRAAGLEPAEAERLRPWLGSGPIGTAFRTGQPVRTAGAGMLAAALPWLSEGCSLLAAPLSSAQHTYGVLFCLGQPGAAGFSDADARLAGTLAAQAAVAWENILHWQRIEAHANELEQQIEVRKEAERALAISEQKFATAFHSSPQPMILTASSGCVLEVNEAFFRIAGLSRGEVIGRNEQELGVWLGASPAQLLRAETGGRPLAGRDCLFRTKAGETRHGLVSADRIQLVEGECVIAILQDVTDQRRVEEQLRHAQRLESVGVLAAGVAHDFNNLLTAITGNISLVLDGAPLESDECRMLRAAISAAGRASDLTRQLLAYAGKGVTELAPVNLTAIARETENLLRSSIPKRINFVLDLDASVPFIEADAGQIQQVILNLVLNSVEAIGDNSGTVTLRTGPMDAAGRNRRPGPRHALLEVRDDGCGMDEATRARMFDPFFSTKFLGRGLGLAAVHGIVKSHGGRIEVTSGPGAGTSFVISFPASVCPAARPERERVAVPLPAPSPGCDLILVVEDEDDVRAVTRRAIERYGFRVVEARDGRQAVLLFEQLHERICMVLLDLSLPELDGGEAYRLFLRVRPEVKVLVTTGLADSEVTRRFPASVEFIQKPYSASQLAGRIAEVLARNSR